jgi:DNA-3-methyladenine glycosylase II
MLDQKKIKRHFKRVDPVIYEVMKAVDFGKWWERPKREYFAALTEDIVNQQLSGKAADSIFTRFKNLFPKKVISPEHILKLNDQKIRDIGMSWGKVKYVKDLAAKVLDKTVQLDIIEKLPDEEVMRELVKVKGIGPWTAEMFLIFTLKREDVFSFGDLGLNKAIIKIYRLKTPSRTRLEKIIKPWSPYKSFASLTLWNSLDNV